MVSTTPSTHEYEAGRRRHTRKSRNSVHRVKKTRLGPPCGSSGRCRSTYSPMKKKRNPEKQAYTYDAVPSCLGPSWTSRSRRAPARSSR
ncbi:MAG: hypothetical protein B7Z68_00015 [Acidobacteria bacterium 21-70-11]|nr:MAG: hypothetical protein B7Z68_00015 [Acidobacteria bacterium 21-70-11]